MKGTRQPSKGLFAWRARALTCQRSSPCYSTTVLVGHTPYWVFLVLLAVSLLGCGTTRWTDTQRTLTEQWLISDAIDHAVAQIDFRVLREKTVYVDAQYIDPLVVDRGYLISSIRQVLLASGCLLQEDRNKATYVVELRSGGIGTDRHDILLGVPPMSIPTFY